jgi:DNA-binding protein HU-beta
LDGRGVGKGMADLPQDLFDKKMRSANAHLFRMRVLPLIFSCQALPIPVQTHPVMNKSELIESIHAALGPDATKRAAEESLDAVLSSIVKGIKSSGKVQIVGFGTFEVKTRAARMGRNPKTGESMQLAASKSLGFKAAASLKSSL